MRTIRIFLASSNELEADRKAFAMFLADKTKLWQEDRDMSLVLDKWENFIDAVSHTRLQDEYNKAIKECDIFVMLFWTKVGMYTDEEFETALQQFKASNAPRIYTYLKDVDAANPKQESLEKFGKKLKDIGHFPTIYKNTEGLLLHFSEQLDKLYRLKTPEPEQKIIKSNKGKDEIKQMIDQGDIGDAFEELNKFFIGKNDKLNALINEFINQPNNYNQANFTMRLKVFVNQSRFKE